MSDETPGVVYSAGWVLDPAVAAGLPAASRRALVAEEVRDRREAEQDAAALEDAREAAATRARIDGRVKVGLQGVFDAALRRQSADDYSANRRREQRVAAALAEEEYGPESTTRSDVETDRLLERASELHRWLVGYQATREVAR